MAKNTSDNVLTCENMVTRMCEYFDPWIANRVPFNCKWFTTKVPLLDSRSFSGHKRHHSIHKTLDYNHRERKDQEREVNAIEACGGMASQRKIKFTGRICPETVFSKRSLWEGDCAVSPWWRPEGGFSFHTFCNDILHCGRSAEGFGDWREDCCKFGFSGWESWKGQWRADICKFQN